MSVWLNDDEKEEAGLGHLTHVQCLGHECDECLEGKGMRHGLEQMLNKKHKPVMIVGHSLGGAIATVACYHMLLEAEKPEQGNPFYNLRKTRDRKGEEGGFDSQVALWTFASPRVGNEHFSEVFEQVTNTAGESKSYADNHVWRVFTDGDPVSEL